MVQKNYNKKILIISSNFYPEITRNLLDGVTQVLDNEKKNYESKFVRGSLELPFFLEKYKNNFEGFIILGCIIKGETDHYDIVKNISMGQIYKIAYKNNLALSSALLTVENYSQALERSEVSKKNLGGLAAKTCLELIQKLNE